MAESTNKGINPGHYTKWRGAIKQANYLCARHKMEESPNKRNHPVRSTKPDICGTKSLSAPSLRMDTTGADMGMRRALQTYPRRHSPPKLLSRSSSELHILRLWSGRLGHKTSHHLAVC